MGLTIRVDNRGDVKVVAVQGIKNQGILVLVAYNELVGEVFNRLLAISLCIQTPVEAGKGRTGATSHSRAWAVPCQTTAGLPRRLPQR